VVAIVLGVAVLAGIGGCARTTQAPGSTVRFDLAADPQNLNPLFLTPDAASVELQAARLAFEPFIDRVRPDGPYRRSWKSFRLKPTAGFHPMAGPLRTACGPGSRGAMDGRLRPAT
jgi:hypothetical protein